MPAKPYRHLTFKESLICAWKGLCWAVSTQRNLRAQIGMGALTSVLGVVARLDSARMAVLFLAIALVLAIEMVNTSLEALVDQLYPEFNAAAGKVKDVAAGAALMVAIGAMAVGIWLFWGSWEGAWLQRAAGAGMAVAWGVFLCQMFPRRSSL